MRSVVSHPSLAAVAALVAAGVAASVFLAARSEASDAAGVALGDAVERTLATGTARIEGRVTSGAGSAVAFAGVVSWRDPGGSSSVAAWPVAGDRRAHSAEVRVTGGRAWLRSPRAASWVAVDPEVVGVAGREAGWNGLLTRLEPVPDDGGEPARGTTIRARAGREPAVVWLDARGRIRRIRVDGDAATLDVRLTELGVKVVVEPP